MRNALLRTAILVRFTYFVGCFALLATFYFLCVGVGHTANSVAAYRVTPISPPPGFTNVVPTDINSHGQIVGYGFNGTTTQPFIADTGSFTPIALPPFFINGFGLGINASGQIVGWGDYRPPMGAPVTQVFVGGIGGIAGVGTGGLYNYAYDINDSGEFVGHAQEERPLPCFDVFAAFVRSPNGSGRRFFTDSFWAEFGFSINNLGQVAGIGQNFTVQNLPPPPTTCLFVFTSGFQIFLGDVNGIATVIPVPTGWSPETFCCGTADSKMPINDSGQIAAMVRPTNGADIFRIALSTRSNTFLIPLPAGVLSVTRPSLNNLGQVVGQIDRGTGGWIWDATNGTRLLQALAPPGWTILSADGINDQGQIVARASNSSTGFSGPVILDPEVVNTPERPTGLNAVCNSASQVTVKWQSVPNATSYYLRINDPATSNVDYSVDGLVQTTHTANVTTGHEYQWWVHAANAAGLSASAQSSFTCPAPAADTTAPSISGLAVNDITSSSASITWTTDELAYGQVEFNAPCPPSGCLTPFVSPMRTSHRLDVANLADSTTYTFRVRVKDASGNTTTSAPQTFKTAALPNVTPTTPPATPINLEALCIGATQVVLRWSPAATADAYYLRINDLGKATPTPYDYVVDGLRATAFTANVTSGHNYVWWVHAANSIGLGPSAQASFTCP